MSLVLRLILAALIAGAGAWAYRAIYDAGRTAGLAEEKVLWDTDRRKQDQLVAAAIAANAAQLQAEAQRNQEKADDYEARISNLTAVAADYADRLRVAAKGRATTDGGAVPQAASQPTVAPAAAAPGEGQAGGLLGAVGDRLAECDINEAQLTALQAEIAPQLH